MSQGLAELLETAARVVPGLDGQLDAGTATAAWCDADAQGVLPLARELARLFPEAGPHYWALRCWGLHIWQPIYLGVIAAHVCGCGPKLDALSQTVRGGQISGFTIGAHAVCRESEDACLASGAAQLAAGCARLFQVWREVGPLHPKAAGRLQADCVLGAVLAVRRHRPDWDNEHAIAVGQQWLAAMGLAGESGFLRYPDADGIARLALARKVCCLHYRRSEGEMCDTCPRLRVPERIARLSAQCRH
jgi:siderophore ferric iron reductase